MKIIDGWLICKIAAADRVLEECAIDYHENTWVPATIKISSIIAISPFYENSGQIDGTGVTQINGDSIIVDVPYGKMKEIVITGKLDRA